MGGKLWLRSTPGVGSTFHFTARFALPPTEGQEERRAPAELRGLRVLVVDDNATNRRILEEMLESWHMKPSATRGGRQALAALRRAHDQGRPFSLVLVDGRMPEMDGFDLAGRIQSDPISNRAPILMLTSAGQTDEVARCGELGVAGYLTKPVKQSDLWDAIVTVLAGSDRAPRRVSRGAVVAARPGPGRLKILVAEDNPVNQELARRILEKRGHTVVVASDGLEVLDAVESTTDSPFDLVLMDVQMPRMSGLEATVAIREKEKGSGRRLPIVALTAHAMKGDKERCLKAGMDDYLSKPVQAGKLLETVGRLAVSKAKGKRRPAPPSDGGRILVTKTLLERVEGDLPLLKRMIHAFRSDYPATLEEIRDAIKERDAGTLKSRAHALKGSAATFSAPLAAGAALRLEILAKDGDLRRARDAYRVLAREIRKLDRSLGVFTAPERSRTSLSGRVRR